MKDIRYLSELASDCEGIAINHKKTIFLEEGTRFYEDIRGYKFSNQEIEIYVSLLTEQTNSFDVIFKGEHVFSGLGIDAYSGSNEADIYKYKRGEWENIIKKLSEEIWDSKTFT